MSPTASAQAPFPDRWALLALALAAGLARWLTRSPAVYNWDTVHYILAQDRYSLPDHQPHPPGSLYYVLAARAIRVLCGDPHTALLLLSSIFRSMGVVALYLLGQELGGRRAAWFAAPQPSTLNPQPALQPRSATTSATASSTARAWWFISAMDCWSTPTSAPTAAGGAVHVRAALGGNRHSGRRPPWRERGVRPRSGIQ